MAPATPEPQKLSIERRARNIKAAMLSLSRQKRLPKGDAQWEAASNWYSYQPRQAEVVPYLRALGYAASSFSDWYTSPATPGSPELKLSVSEHVTKPSHPPSAGQPWYLVQCEHGFPGRTRQWCAPRLLTQLRRDLHDPIKNILGSTYTKYFGETPFAQLGGPSGTTARLQAWLEALGRTLRSGEAPPSAVATAMLFFLAPAVAEEGAGDAEGSGSSDAESETQGHAPPCEAPPGLFHVVVSWPNSKIGRQLPLGIAFEPAARLWISVRSVPKKSDGSLIQQWNEEHEPEEQVRAGDRILAVNGVCGDRELMVEEVLRATALRLLLERPTRDGSAADAMTQQSSLSSSANVVGRVDSLTAADLAALGGISASVIGGQNLDFTV